MIQAINSCVKTPHFETSAPQQLKDFIFEFNSEEQNKLEHDYYSSMELAVISCYYPEEAKICEIRMPLDQSDFLPWATTQPESGSLQANPPLNAIDRSGKYIKQKFSILSQLR